LHRRHFVANKWLRDVVNLVSPSRKALRHAKQRLESVLEPEERTGLARVMALDVFAAAAATYRLDGVAVITADSLIASFARRAGFRVITDEIEAGFRAVAEAGARILGRSGVGGIFSPSDRHTTCNSRRYRCGVT
jgi:2-phospho-L-lactate guanylyltransferase (CobY/MobA/RfbA family)